MYNRYRKLCMIKRYFILLTILFILINSNSMANQPKNIEYYKKKISFMLEPFSYCQLVYATRTNVRYFDKSVLINNDRTINELKDVLVRRNNLIPELSGRWTHVSTENIINIIKELEIFSNGYNLYSIDTYSSYEKMRRRDVSVYNLLKLDIFSYYYIFRDKKSVRCDTDCTFDDSKIFTYAWMNPEFTSMFGCNLNFFIDNGFTVLLTKDKVRLTNKKWYSRYTRFDFTLLNDENSYWTKCEFFHKNKLYEFINCEEFKKYGNQYVPEKVTIYKKGVGEDFYIFQSMHLISVDFEPVYDRDYFEYDYMLKKTEGFQLIFE